jgi:hypothetical protein
MPGSGWRSGPRAARVAMALLAGVLALMVWHVRRFPGTDVSVYADAGRLFRAGRPLYQHGFRYLPGTAAIFVPLTLIPAAAVKVAWAAVSAVLIAVAVARLARGLPPDRRWAAPVAALALFHPIARELQLGQVDALVLAAAVLAFELEDRGRDLAAGAVLALPVVLKIAPVLLVVAAAAQRRWRVVMGSAAGVILLTVPAVLRYGPAGVLREHASWLSSQAALTAVHLDNRCNQSLPGILHRAGAGPVAATAAALLVAALALSVRGLEGRRTVTLAALPLVTANGWVEAFVLALPLVTMLVGAGGASGWVAFALALGTGLLGFDVLGARGETWTLVHGLFGADLLALLLLGWARVRRSRALAVPVPGPV